MSKPRIAIVGCGYWGRNLIRNFAELRNVEVSVACDFNLNALAIVKRRYPAIELEPKFQGVLDDPSIDALVIATPVSTHFPFARRALVAGKHVLVEKPMATSSTEALELLELAERRGKILMVDHTFVYTGAVQYAKTLVESQQLGDLLYFDSVRLSLGFAQNETNVLWDLGAHDFSILSYLSDQDPVAVAATGVRHLGSVFENVAYVSAQFSSKLIAHFHLNWLSPVKVRRILIGGSKKMLSYDDMEISEKIKVYGNGLTSNLTPEGREQLLTGYQNGDMVAPRLHTEEALSRMATDFADALYGSSRPVCDAYAGYRVVRLLEAAQRSMMQGGGPVELPSLDHSPKASSFRPRQGGRSFLVRR